MLIITIIVATVFNSCGYGDGDKHPDVKLLSSLNSYPEKLRLLRIVADSGQLKMMARKQEYTNGSDFVDYNDLYRIFPGRNSWYYIARYNDDTFFDCNMKTLNLSVKDICGSEDFALYPLEPGKLYIDVYKYESHNDTLSSSRFKSRILLADIDSRKVYQQFDCIAPSFIGSILQYMKSKGDTLRTLNRFPPLFYLEPESYSLYEKEIKLFDKIYPQAQRDILQLMDKHRDEYVSIDGDSVKSFDYNKVYSNLLSRLQYTGSTTGSSNTPGVYQESGLLFFMNHAVAIEYYMEGWKPDSMIPSLSKFKNLPVPQNRVNVALHQFDYSLVWQSMPHLLKGSATRNELYYYNLSVGNDTLSFKCSQPVYLFESRRLKNGKVIIALSTEEFNPKDDSKEVSDKLHLTGVLFLLYDPEKVSDPAQLSESEWREIR